MKLNFLLPFIAAAALVCGAPAQAADAKAELKELVGKVQAKLKEGKRTEADLTAEIKEFDALLASHKGEKTDDVAQILVMKAMLYVQIFEDSDKALPMFEQLKKDFPETKPGKDADRIIGMVKQQAEAMKVKKSLAVGSTFPDFQEKDLAGKPLSIANYKGKVVLIDFWATWCGPCVAELPNVLKAYEKHHAKGFEIIGISLDQSQDALNKFIKERNMTWPQYFDGKGWQSKLAGKYGVNSIPATYLLDGEGKIIGKDLRGDELEQAVAKALAGK
ncbi:MAG: TlpA disulfide reductase family protein [Verrucomicrobiota bacterium]